MHNNFKISTLVVFLFALIGCSNSNKIPVGKINISDNELTSAEWEGSQSIKISDSINLKLFQHTETLYLGIDFGRKTKMNIDG